MIKINTNFDEVEQLFDSLTDLERDLLAIVERGIQIVVTRAKFILTEKDHILSGTLIRSLMGIVTKMTNDVIEGEIGSPMDYAYYVEELPDGGYLFEALEQTFDKMKEYIIRELRKRLL